MIILSVLVLVHLLKVDLVFLCVQFTIEHYNTSGVKTSGVDEVVTLTSNVFNSTVNKSYSAGSMCVKVSSVGNLSDIDARYRIALYFQSSDELV